MIVVTGANGRLGRFVAHQLAQQGRADKVMLTSRNPDQIADLAELGFRTVAADFADVASLKKAFAGATTLLMISVPGPMDVRMPLHRNCVDAARSANIDRLVYTSRVNPSLDSLYPFAKIHAFTEAHIKASGLTYTIVRNSEYIENISGAIAEAANTGKLILPGASGRVAHISVVDIAKILASLLIGEGHANKTYELNGPEALNRDEIASLLAHVIQQPVVATPISREDFGALRKSQGRPPFMVDMAMGLFEAIDASEFAKVWPDAELLLGRAPTSVREHILNMHTAK
jgi:NAD(P)H dehydrogenase (quinone)